MMYAIHDYMYICSLGLNIANHTVIFTHVHTCTCNFI